MASSKKQGTNILKDFLPHCSPPPPENWTLLVRFVQVTGKDTKTGETTTLPVDPRPILTDTDDWALRNQRLPASLDEHRGTHYVIGHVVRHNRGYIVWETFTVYGHALVYNSLNYFDEKSGAPVKGPGGGYFNAFGLGWQEDTKAEMPRELFREMKEDDAFPKWDVVEVNNKRKGKQEEEEAAETKKTAKA